MAIKVGGTEVVSNARELKNIATIDSGTVTAFNSALNTDPTKGTLTKTFTQNETAEITLSSNVTVGPVVSATKEIPQTGVSTKGNWDVNSTASNYDFHDTATAVTLTPNTVGYDLSALSYDNKSFNHASAPNTNDIAISSDGTKLYYVGNDNYLWQIPLSTAFDVSSGGTPVYFDQSSTDNNPQDVTFKPDGTKMYLTGDQANWIYQFNLSTAWDITTAGGSGNSFITTNQTSSPRGTQFKSDGTKMYVMSTTNIYEYSLSTAWDVSTASYTTNNISINGQDGNQMGMFLKPDGTKMFVVGQNNDKVYQYNFGTAWDLSTASYSNTSSAAFASTLTTPRGITFSADGAKLYIIDFNTAYVHQFTVGAEALALGSGSFASTDVGKRITGNGGDVVLTSTAGAFSTTGGSAFTDSSTIAAGSWQMFGLKSAGDASGITVAGLNTIVPLNLSNASYDNVFGNLSNSQNGSDDGVFFKPDGTRMYVLDTGGGSNNVWQYDLSTAWDASTASYNSVNKSVNANSSTGGGIFFKPDGLKMYIVDAGDVQIDEWTLSTAWDLSSASYTTNGGISAGGNIGTPQGIFWKPDGSSFYVGCKYYNQIIQFNNNSGYTWNINNWTRLSPFSISGQESEIHDIEFTSDGTKMLIVGRGSDKVHQYTLSTAWDITTASYNSVYLDVSSQTTQPNGMHLKADDESKLYVVASGGVHKVYQYSTGASTTFVQPTSQYHVGVTNTSGRIASSAFTDINGMTAAQAAGTGTVNYAVSTDGRTTWNVNKGTDGVRPIVRNNSGTWQYNSSSPAVGYQLSNASYDNVNFSVATQETSLGGMVFNNTGTKAYVIGRSSNTIYQYSLSTAFDISTMSYDSVSFSVSSQEAAVGGVVFNNNGTKLYIVGYGTDKVFQYSLSTGYDLSTTSYDSVSFSVGSQTNLPQAVLFNGDGTKMYVCGDNGDSISQYDLSTAFDLSTASYNSVSFSFANEATNPTGIRFNSDGTKLFAVHNGGVIYQYTLSTAYNVSTSSYDSVSFNVSSQDNAPHDIVFSNDGTKLFVAGDQQNKIFQYSTSTPAYGTSTTWVNGTVNDELYTLQQALTAQAFNRMDKTQLDAVPDANHFSTGSSLDLMIALRMDTAASTLPTSDGVTLNYDAAALNEGAVLGTDYDFFHPAANKVQIKSLAAQNLKVRVV